MIVGKRVYLRAIEKSDLQHIADWRNSPDIYQFFYEHEPLSLEMENIWFEKFLKKTDEKLWIIQAIDRSVPIGMVGLINLDSRNRKGEWGRFLIADNAYRTGGYGSEVEAIIIKYYFDHLNMNRLQCEVITTNEKVTNLHKKFGFKQEGTFREYLYKDGKYVDITYFAMLRSDYLSNETQEMIKKYLGEMK